MVDATEIKRRKAVMAEAAIRMDAQSAATDAFLDDRLEATISEAVASSKDDAPQSVEEAISALRSVEPLED